MEEALLCAARKLLRCGESIEAALAQSLTKSDGLSERASYVLSDALAKLVRDVAGTPVTLGSIMCDAKAMRCTVECLHECLARVQPEKLKTPAQLDRAEGAVRKLCARHHLPSKCADVFVLLTYEVANVFWKLDAAIEAVASKPRNAEILKRRVRHFFRDVRADLLCFAFNSLKLTVCLRSAAESRLHVKGRVKDELHSILRRVSKQLRVMASVNEVHSENVLTAAAMAQRRKRRDSAAVDALRSLDEHELEQRPW